MWGGCPNPTVPDLGGKGGKTLSYSSPANKLFFGGGGGCGQGNNLGEKAGGNGGGIIIINAGNIQSNNGQIIASGSNGIECTGPGGTCDDDGTGGGGGGGLIAINAPVAGTLNAITMGGKGGNAYLEFPATIPQVGPGGGGGGGTIWHSGAALPAGLVPALTGGLNGILPQYSNDNYGAMPGSGGMAVSNLPYTFPTDSFVAPAFASFSNDTVVCPGTSVTITAAGGTTYTWTPAGSLSNANIANPVATPAATTTYFVTVGTPRRLHRYRLRNRRNRL